MKKILYYLKFIIHVIFAILIWIFSSKCSEFFPTIVASLIILYAIEDICKSIFFIEEKEEKIRGFFRAGLLLLFAFIMFINAKEFIVAAVVWAVWSIYREGQEIFDQLFEHRRLWVGILNVIESVVVIFFSFELIRDPSNIEHIYVHIILLGFELLLAVIFPLLDNIRLKKI